MSDLIEARVSTSPKEGLHYCHYVTLPYPTSVFAKCSLRQAGRSFIYMAKHSHAYVMANFEKILLFQISLYLYKFF